MATITAVTPQRRAGRVSIFVDGQFAAGVHEEIAAALGLRPGLEVDESDLQGLISVETRRRAKEDAVRLLSFRARSREELRRRLERKGYESDVVVTILDELSQSQLLDDHRFAQAWIEARTTARPLGSQRIAWELRQKGVAPETVEAELSAGVTPEAEQEHAMAAGRQLVQRLRGSEPAVARRRLAAALQRRGFSWSVTAAVLRELLAPDSDDLDHA